MQPPDTAAQNTNRALNCIWRDFVLVVEIKPAVGLTPVEALNTVALGKDQFTRLKTLKASARISSPVPSPSFRMVVLLI